MKKTLSLAIAAACAAPLSGAQAAQQQSFSFTADGLARYEWTKDLFDSPDQSRWRLQARPRLEFNYKSLQLGVGGEFNYSDDENTLPPPGATSLAILRDNYDSRDARVDLAF